MRGEAYLVIYRDTNPRLHPHLGTRDCNNLSCQGCERDHNGKYQGFSYLYINLLDLGGNANPPILSNLILDLS